MHFIKLPTDITHVTHVTPTFRIPTQKDCDSEQYDLKTRAIPDKKRSQKIINEGEH